MASLIFHLTLQFYSTCWVLPTCYNETLHQSRTVLVGRLVMVSCYHPQKNKHEGNFFFPPHPLTSNKKVVLFFGSFHAAVNVTHGAFQMFLRHSWLESKPAPAHLFSKPHKGFFSPKVDCHLKMSSWASISKPSRFNLSGENPNNISLLYLNDLTSTLALLASC